MCRPNLTPKQQQSENIFELTVGIFADSLREQQPDEEDAGIVRLEFSVSDFFGTIPMFGPVRPGGAHTQPRRVGRVPCSRGRDDCQ